MIKRLNAWPAICPIGIDSPPGADWAETVDAAGKKAGAAAVAKREDFTNSRRVILVLTREL
jgi:hypothetical protein